QAYSDSVPVLVIASSPVRASLGRHWGVLHELADQRALAAGVTAFAGSARTAEDLREQLRRAFAALRAPRPRPAYVDIPLDLLTEHTLLRSERFALPTPAGVSSGAGIAAAQGLFSQTQQAPLIPRGGDPTARASSRAAAPAAPPRRSASWWRRWTAISSRRPPARGSSPKAILPISA